MHQVSVALTVRLSCRDQVKASMLFALRTLAYCSTAPEAQTPTTLFLFLWLAAYAARALLWRYRYELWAAFCSFSLYSCWIHRCAPTALCAGLLWALTQQATGVLKALHSSMITESWTSSAGSQSFLPRLVPLWMTISKVHYTESRPDKQTNLLIFQISLIIV